MSNPIPQKKIEDGDLTYEEEKSLSDPQRVQLVKKYIEEGLTEGDAAILAGFTTKEYIMLKEKNPKAALVVAKAQIRLEHKFLRVITDSAKTDSRLATWMLEKRFGDKYNQKARTPTGDDGGEGLLTSAIRDVQKDEMSTAFVGISRKINKKINE